MFNTLRLRFLSGVRFYSSKETAGVPIIVQKFGGTSLGTSEKIGKVVNIINNNVEKNKNVVAVVSAFSSETKEEGTTTRLLSAANAAVNGDPEGAFGFISAIEETHLEVINGSLESPKEKVIAQDYVHSELKRIRQFCESLAVIEELSPKSHDLIIGVGEKLSAGVLSCVLREHGLKAAMVDLSLVFKKGLDTTQRNYSSVAKNAFGTLLKPLVEEGSLPVVTGFFGQVRGGIISSVGRGYTDLTAALCAGAIGAEQLQVWKESDGVFTGNPTKIAKAQLIGKVTPGEAAELTYFGNEVLHPFTMACAISDNVPIAILNTFKPDGEGTVISSEWEGDQTVLEDRPGTEGITAICSKNNITTLNLSSVGLVEDHTFLSEVFEIFHRHQIKADLISTSMNKLTVTLHESTSELSLTPFIADLSKVADCEREDNKAIVSCIGHSMRHKRGMAAKVFKSLSDADINIEMISQGASEINISVVIDQQQQNDAIHCLHKTLIEAPMP